MQIWIKIFGKNDKYLSHKGIFYKMKRACNIFLKRKFRGFLVYEFWTSNYMLSDKND